MANTGVKNVLTLRKYVNGVATSEFKANVSGDPDYIAPYVDLVDCPVSGTTTTTTIAPCVSGLDAVVCGYSVGSSEEACAQTNVVIAYKTDLWLNFGTVVYSSADGCSTALGFYAPLPGEEGEGSVFQVNQSGDVVASANCDAGTTEPPTVYNVGFRTNTGSPTSSFACGTADQTLYASTPTFANVTIGTRIYANTLGTALQGGNLWFGIASTSGASTKTILVDNTGIVTNEGTCESSVTTTTLPPASIAVYASVPLDPVGITVQYSVNGGAFVNDGSGSVTSTCGLLSTITGLLEGDSVVVRVVGTTTGTNYPINAVKSTVCPTGITGATTTYNYGAVAEGTNNLAIVIDNVPTVYTQQLGYNSTSAVACSDYENNIVSNIYADASTLLGITRIYATSEGTSLSTQVGWYSDGNNAIFWNGTNVDGQVVCEGSGGIV